MGRGSLLGVPRVLEEDPYWMYPEYGKRSPTGSIYILGRGFLLGVSRVQEEDPLMGLPRVSRI